MIEEYKSIVNEVQQELSVNWSQIDSLKKSNSDKELELV